MKWNPFTLHAHNGWKLPRVVYHLSHAALGLPIAGLGLLHVSPIIIVSLVIIACFIDKIVWLHWGPTVNHFRHVTLVWHPWVVTDYVDLLSDSLLTAMGASIYLWWFDWRIWGLAIVFLYLCGVFNGE